MTRKNSINGIIPVNLTAKADFNVPGNPPSTRPEDGVGNCYPGLEYDHRNLDRRFFPGLVVEFVSRSNMFAPDQPWGGVRVVAVDTSDPALNDTIHSDLAEKLRHQLGGADGDRLGASLPIAHGWFLYKITQGEKSIVLEQDGKPLGGSQLWWIVYGLAPDTVTLHVVLRDVDKSWESAGSGDEIVLHGWRRQYSDPDSGVISAAYQPGELTQSLCSPWMHDFRDCACWYWASNHPDIVLGEVPPGTPTLPDGAPLDPQLANIRQEWLRDDRSPAMMVESLDRQPANIPYQMSHYEINECWEQLAIVLEGRETPQIYQPRRRESNIAQFDSPQKLAAQLEELASLELLVALLYLYARSSVLTPDEARKLEKWPTLADDVYFIRRHILLIAVGEMQHLRWANQILWKLAQSGMTSSYRPVLYPASHIPPSGPVKQPIKARLAPLTADTLQLFVHVEQPSGYIDGRYSKVTETLKSSPNNYPKELYELASRIVTDGEQHFNHFRQLWDITARYDPVNPAYLRADFQMGQEGNHVVDEALSCYQTVLDNLGAAYQLGDAQTASDLIAARDAMHLLDDLSDQLAREHNCGVPYF